MNDRDVPNPGEWRVVWPVHAEEIERATEAVLTAIYRLTIRTGDSMVEAAAARWAIEQIEVFVTSELDAELLFGRFEDDDEAE